MEKVQPNEVCIVVDGGIVQQIGLGKDVPRNLRITLTDYDLDGQTPEDDPHIESNGYGELAFCSVLYEPEELTPKESIDADGTQWL